MNTHYYFFVQKADGYHGLIYKYDSTGQREIIVWQSTEAYDNPNDAIDAASIHADAAGFDVELGS